MKSFLTLFVFIATVLQISFAQYCGDACDASKKPTEVRQGRLQLVAKFDNTNQAIQYQVNGTVVIESDCVFKVQNFFIYPPAPQVKWYGAASVSSQQGINLSDEEVAPVNPNTPVELTYDVSKLAFCKASLLKNVGVVRLVSVVDNTYQLIAQAVVYEGKTTEGTNSSGNSTSNKTDNDSGASFSAKWSIATIAISILATMLFI